MKKDGISRKGRTKLKNNKKFISWNYFDAKGKLIVDPKVKERCNLLVLPPAWRDVWISLNAKAHLQATGKDAKGRLQYRYHQNWTEARAAEKI
ncbi:MAG: hypothetical protein IPJ20_26685 [Flammeovirgaceae bacterium]|nr:hypothetical protein [Flammeovirgaceae bacterium]